MKTNKASERKNWTADEILSGITESPAAERVGYRYTVFVDGETLLLDTKRQLSKVLSDVYSTAPKVFRNAGKGITIDFDL